MANALVTIYPNELQRLLYSPGGPVGRHIVMLARETAAEAERLAVTRGAPKMRSGRYAKNFRIETDFTGPNGFTVRVRNATTGQTPLRRRSYAGVIEAGSTKHIIKARAPEGWLKFFWRGRWVTVRQVTHPGTRPYFILRDALRTTILKHGGR